ncbi:adenylate/guanylate cyclase domain-containing protein [Magnetofaba australis]|uniref:Putative adenylate/guanylate cyclase n=1 Tax=Magnetofaba australis IT-1 TaxID=1434232 RepID=A0A1Y2K109_9PROT|nr:adenylate/guanylate cyclase domain-containing protein [Magnetofaba australis]OSM01688.1 putative adenylate/guanylate cyclase [Magnetofaba australis IT-1]
MSVASDDAVAARYALRFRIGIFFAILALMALALALTFQITMGAVLDHYSEALDEEEEKTRILFVETQLLMARQSQLQSVLPNIDGESRSIDMPGWLDALTRLQLAHQELARLVAQNVGDSTEAKQFTQLSQSVERLQAIFRHAEEQGVIVIEELRRLEALTEAALKLVDDMAAYIDKEMREIRQEALNKSRKSVRWGWSVAAAAIVLSLLVATLLVRRLTRKLGAIAQGVQRVAQGRLDQPIALPHPTQRDELDLIGEHINQAATQLDAAQREARRERDHLAQVSQTLANFFPPQVRERILSGRLSDRIASQRRKLTVFFSDLVGFTRAVENMEAEDLTRLLNEYFHEMSEIALAHGGVIDKYVGDAMLVFFGDDEGDVDPREGAAACVAMAAQMQQSMVGLRQRWANQGVARPFHVRMGIATGYCAVGIFGSEKRRDYTIIGNTVNLASRLESAAQPDEALVSHETYVLTRELFHFTPREPMTVKGVAEPVQAYSVGEPRGAQGGGVIAREGRGFSLFLDADSLDDAARESLAEALARASKSLQPPIN